MTVQQGKPATLTCVVPKGFTRRQVQWYKQSAGDNLKMITSLRTQVNPTFGPGFHPSRFEITDGGNEISLTILKTPLCSHGLDGYHLEYNVFVMKR